MSGPSIDEELMRRAVDVASRVQGSTAPNPWVGTLVVTAAGDVHEGATQPVGGPHAEVVALRRAGEAAEGATLVTTLEPCGHHGRTPPCTDAIVAAGIRRVVLGIRDPDPLVAGKGAAALRAAGLEVTEGVCAAEVAAQLEPYLHHRLTGRPFVTLKLATTLDGRLAAPNRDGEWITGIEARTDAHRLRARCDSIMVGAGTIRADDPELTVRHVVGRDPERIVLGEAPPGAKVHPCIEISGDLPWVLEDLAKRGVVDLLVEGGPTVAGAFHRAGLVDHYVIYLAPALFGGDDALGLFAGPGAATMEELWRGRITAVTRLGQDLRVDLRPS
jgi:diaminohydroxyphosphoribosylaminopyrimidine deaminase/5-amino-6-(5-phosphoribosylamino)uracil reductase